MWRCCSEPSYTNENSHARMTLDSKNLRARLLQLSHRPVSSRSAGSQFNREPPAPLEACVWASSSRIGDFGGNIVKYAWTPLPRSKTPPHPLSPSFPASLDASLSLTTSIYLCLSLPLSPSLHPHSVSKCGGISH
jgi:hypothetical protein